MSFHKSAELLRNVCSRPRVHGGCHQRLDAISVEKTIRVGSDYQADIPELLSHTKNKCNQQQNSLLVWLPPKKIADVKLNDYIYFAKKKYGYDIEQSLGLLLWNNYNFVKSIQDLPVFSQVLNWSIIDKNNFEVAFQQFGKNFLEIKKILPDKSLKTIIGYYYLRKKKKTAWYGIEVHKLNNLTEPFCENRFVNEQSSSAMSTLNNKDPQPLCPLCGFCYISFHQTQDAMCEQCFTYFSKFNERNRPYLYLPCPDDIHLKFAHLSPQEMLNNQDNLQSIVSISNGQGETNLLAIDNEIQSNNQAIMTRSLYKKLKLDKIDYRNREPMKNCIFPFCNNTRCLRAIQDTFKGRLTIIRTRVKKL
ncbi:REST corepressor spr-1-like [Rhopalosiphum padi]|uniref:REST corepressor spr-1-like n=1 Tax=Rhopalosiphum padi TaxID=40932 RepID=UPI00298E32C6|nr:REST corepressor spr-1-like [Rhopalosiphum padi]